MNNSWMPTVPETNDEAIVQQQTRQKIDADPSGWYQSLLEGGKAEQLRLEELITAIRKHVRRLDLVAIILTVFSTSALMTSLGDFFPSLPKLPIVLAGVMNLAIALTIALKRFKEDNGALFQYETLHDEFGAFFLALMDPNKRRQPMLIAEQLFELEAKVVRVAPEIRSDKNWDNMTVAQRQQYLQQRIAQ